MHNFKNRLTTKVTKYHEGNQDAVSRVHQVQILSYLKLSGKSIGLLINFNVVHLQGWTQRFVNGTGWK